MIPPDVTEIRSVSEWTFVAELARRLPELAVDGGERGG